MLPKAPKITKKRASKQGPKTLKNGPFWDPEIDPRKPEISGISGVVHTEKNPSRRVPKYKGDKNKKLH
jgi:hypothetical protein